MLRWDSVCVSKTCKISETCSACISQKELVEDALHLNSLPEAAQRSMPFLLTKSTEWRYEREWRVVCVANEGERSHFTDLAFSRCSLSKILLGCRISPAQRRAVEKLATGDVEIYQA